MASAEVGVGYNADQFVLVVTVYVVASALFMPATITNKNNSLKKRSE